VLLVTTAAPRPHLAQDTLTGFARHGRRGKRNLERLLPISDTAEVESRDFCVSAEWLYEDHTLPEKNSLSGEILRDYDNVFSATALFASERFLESEEGAAGEHGVLSALRPSFSTGRVLFRC
jgi:predicted naringenin-chalcone synthase